LIDVRKAPRWSDADRDAAERRWVRLGLDVGSFDAFLSLAFRTPKPTTTDVADLVEQIIAGAPTTEHALPCGDERQQSCEPSDHGLWLEHIELENFRQFKRTSFALKSTRELPIVLIEAPNGYGKSALIRALQFGLGLESDGVAGSSLVSAGCTGSEADVKVVLRFRSDVHGPFEVRRICRHRHSVAGWTPSGVDDIVVSVGGKNLHADEATAWLAATFPAELLSFFVFDAESKIVSALKGDSGKELPSVKPLVEAALGIQPIRAFVVVLKSYAEDRRGIAKSAQKKIQQEERDHKQIETSRTEREAKAEQLIEDEQSLAEQVAVAEKEMEPYRVAIEPERQARLKEVQEARAEAERKVIQARDERTRLVSEVLPRALLHLAARSNTSPDPEQRDPQWRTGADHAVHHAAKVLAARRFPWIVDPPSEAEIEQAIRGAINLPSAKDEHRAVKREKQLMRLREVTEPSRVKLRSMREYQSLRDRKGGLDDLQRELTQLGGNAANGDLLQRYADIDLRWRDLKRKRDETRAALDHVREEIEAHGDRADPARDSPAHEAQLREVEKDREKAKTADNIAKAIGSIADEILDTRVKALARTASDMLLRTAHKHDVLHHVEIKDPIYRYVVMDKDDRPAPGDRSTGERNLLALCLVHAIREASGVHLPMVVEAPLRVLDPDHKRKVVSELLAGAKGQMVLLVTPEELSDSFDYQIRTRIAQRLQIVPSISGGECREIREKEKDHG
jgi:DNA sulfur modification protein DndD